MRKILLGLAALAAIGAAPAYADAPRPMLCALTTLQSCDEMDGCTRISHEEANLPRFLTIDLENRKVSGIRPDGSEASTPIRSLYSTMQKALAQGAENGRAWSATISDAGAISVVVTGEDFALAGFGSCTLP